jgi:uncharacterized membrane protein YeiB
VTTLLLAHIALREVTLVAAHDQTHAALAAKAGVPVAVAVAAAAQVEARTEVQAEVAVEVVAIVAVIAVVGAIVAVIVAAEARAGPAVEVNLRAAEIARILAIPLLVTAALIALHEAHPAATAAVNVSRAPTGTSYQIGIVPETKLVDFCTIIT